MLTSKIQAYRDFLKDNVRQQVDFSQTDQSLGVPPPPLEKPYDPEATRFELVAPENWTTIPAVDLFSAIQRRKSHRRFRHASLTLEELSFLLWTTQGIRASRNRGFAFRTVPSAGCRHALETYLCVLNVEELEQGIYRYLPVEHRLVLEFQEEQLAEKITAATLGQRFTGEAAATFVWTTIPYRMEWRYDIAAHKVIALDAGHVCQNLYLACEAIGAGTCAIAAYDQQKIDQLLRVDGEDEFAIYLAAVGKV
ncbi:nitroreductase [Candidatus Vecturithrix granuli]|uniref:Nitroreductase n=1 Tax=Vecturithrix granuli TaxID=1499967 RepID=A0A081C9W3_VECG1|nr:nitroreductase [Candidatus Vecturithrix granuli]